MSWKVLKGVGVGWRESPLFVRFFALFFAFFAGISPFLRESPFFCAFLRFFALYPRRGKQLQFTGKMGSFTPTPSAPTPLRTSRMSNLWLKITPLAAQSSHRKIVVTMVAASGLATILLQQLQGFLRHRQQKIAIACDLRVTLAIAGSSQRPRPQVAAAARFRGHSDHGTLRR